MAEYLKIINTSQFLKFVEHYVKEFKETNGYGRWLAEYERMSQTGMLKPENIREQYIAILNKTSKLSYIYWDAINCIGIQAFDATKAFMSVNSSYEIRTISDKIAIDDSGEELSDLSLEEALSICKAMNEEAEELLFRVYNSNTNKLIL